jgi:hypothetical protein
MMCKKEPKRRPGRPWANGRPRHSSGTEPRHATLGCLSRQCHQCGARPQRSTGPRRVDRRGGGGLIRDELNRDERHRGCLRAALGTATRGRGRGSAPHPAVVTICVVAAPLSRWIAGALRRPIPDALWQELAVESFIRAGYRTFHDRHHLAHAHKRHHIRRPRLRSLPAHRYTGI